LTREVNRRRDGGLPFAAAQGLLRELAGVLGFALSAPAAAGAEAAPFIDLLVEVRRELREAKQWALSDRIRDGLKERGVEVKDGPEGTTWSLG
jgi:cysteinyl-tRNA synthetase